MSILKQNHPFATKKRCLGGSILCFLDPFFRSTKCSTQVKIFNSLFDCKSCGIEKFASSAHFKGAMDDSYLEISSLNLRLILQHSRNLSLCLDSSLLALSLTSASTKPSTRRLEWSLYRYLDHPWPKTLFAYSVEFQSLAHFWIDRNNTRHGTNFLRSNQCLLPHSMTHQSNHSKEIEGHSSTLIGHLACCDNYCLQTSNAIDLTCSVQHRRCSKLGPPLYYGPFSMVPVYGNSKHKPHDVLITVSILSSCKSLPIINKCLVQYCSVKTHILPKTTMPTAISMDAINHSSYVYTSPRKTCFPRVQVAFQISNMQRVLTEIDALMISKTLSLGSHCF